MGAFSEEEIYRHMTTAHGGIYDEAQVPAGDNVRPINFFAEQAEALAQFQRGREMEANQRPGQVDPVEAHRLEVRARFGQLRELEADLQFHRQEYYARQRQEEERQRQEEERQRRLQEERRRNEVEQARQRLLQEERRRQTELERQRRLMASYEAEQYRRQLQERLRQQEERNRQAARQEERGGWCVVM